MSAPVAVFLVMILQTSPSVVIEVGYKLDSMAECQTAKQVILKQQKEKFPMPDCWRIDSPNLLSKDEYEKKIKEPKATLKGKQT